jgi:hypothetical protein
VYFYIIFCFLILKFKGQYVRITHCFFLILWITYFLNASSADQVIEQDLLATGFPMGQALEEATDHATNETADENKYHRFEETVVSRFSWSGGFRLSMYEPVGDPLAIDDVVTFGGCSNCSSGIERP